MWVQLYVITEGSLCATRSAPLVTTYAHSAVERMIVCDARHGTAPLRAQRYAFPAPPDGQAPPRHPARPARAVRLARPRGGVGDGGRGAPRAAARRARGQAGPARGRGRRAGGRRAPALRLARRDQARQRARRDWASTVAGRRCLDVGASTGGFTDCLLQRGAAHVVALDVAYGELDWSLRTDARVTVLERTNARALAPARPALRARPRRRRRLVHLAGQGAAGGARLLRASASTRWRWSSRSSRSGASASARAASCARPRTAARRSSRWPRRRRALGRRGARLRLVGPARARRATARRSCGWPRRGRAGGATRTSRPLAREVEP